MPCRINHKRMWTGRIILESMHTPLISTFLTLTYNEENYPEYGNLVKDDLFKYINRLRHRKGVGHFRYFAVGEYGDKTQRAHYHMALFGIPPTYKEILMDCWSKDGQSIGNIHTGSITKDSASYLASYVTKRKTNPDHPDLDGRTPEFSIQSRRPPLGAPGVRHIEDMLHTRSGAKAIAQMGDVPDSYKVQGNNYPLGTYWKNWLRQRMGITHPKVNSSWQLDYEKVTQETEKASKKATVLWQKAQKPHFIKVSL